MDLNGGRASENNVEGCANEEVSGEISISASAHVVEAVSVCGSVCAACVSEQP